ncbi:MAG TPA: hypothetical protein GXZ39_13215, partial [Bacteroidales bacterium]|nr:hypothetical protein [Bacteroidales bacterium]
GTFLTLTSKNGGAGPAIHTQGAIKVKFVDADTLPGLMGLASGRGHFASRNLKYHHSQFLHRSNLAQSRLAELIEIVADVNELTKLIQHGKKIYSAADESRRNNLRAGDELFQNNTDSALIRARSAQEMAEGHRIDTLAVPVFNNQGQIVKYQKRAQNNPTEFIEISKEEFFSKPRISPYHKHRHLRGW